MAENIVAKNRTGYISLLRIFATITVLFSHACSTLTENNNIFKMSEQQYLFFNICLNIAKWAVPVFFVITGALMLGNKKEICIRDCIYKYSKRMLLALVVFGIPYAMLMQFFNTRSISFSMLWNSLLMVINGESFGHLWYLYAMIGIYLVLPIMKVIVEKMPKKLLKYFLLILFIFSFCIPFVNKVSGLSIAFIQPFGGNVLFYVLLGYYLSQGYLQERYNTRVLGIVGVLFVFFLTIVIGLVTGISDVVMEYNSPINVICAISLYSLFSSMKIQSGKALWKIDRLCFGVYLIHPLFIQFSYKFLKFTPARFKCYPLSIIIFTVVFCVLSFGASWVMSCIKPLKKYVL